MENHLLKNKLVLIPFPFDDLSTTKARPAVCLTEPIGFHQHVVLAFISSRIPNELLPTDIVIDQSDAKFAATGLKVSSVVRLHRLMSVSVNLVKRELGSLPPRLQQAVAQKLRILFGL